MLKKLLYAETRASIKKEIENFVKTHDVEAIEVPTSQDLLVKAVEWFPDCILTGHTPPFINAFDICAYKMADPILSLIPIIVTIPPEDKATAKKLRFDPHVKIVDRRGVAGALEELTHNDDFAVLQTLMIEPSLQPEDRVMSKALEAAGRHFEADAVWGNLSDMHLNCENFDESLDLCYKNLTNMFEIYALIFCFSMPQGITTFIKTSRPALPEHIAMLRRRLEDIIPRECSFSPDDDCSERVFMPPGDVKTFDTSSLVFHCEKIESPSGFRGCVAIVANEQELSTFVETRGDFLKRILVGSFLALEHSLLRKNIDILYTIDAITGVKNRKKIIEILKKEYLRARRYGVSLTICLIDIDDFSRINSFYGYQAGDVVLRDLADIARASLRTIDDVGRYAEDKYLIILPQTLPQDSSVVVSRIKNNILQHKFTGIAKDIDISVSVGVTGCDSQKDVDISAVLHRVEDALDKAKQQGKDSIFIT